ncbi:unnamed protein product [Meloidogyne enterolobii]|uniref:Uncharacterized protein n=1 Tax=Meloidogyne enterolobii TaxID=390850 RepID=A0ACB1AVX1_MELEN
MGCSNLFTGNDFICGKIDSEGCQQKNSWIMSDYNENQPYQTKCEFNFAMNNPKTGQNFIDLTDLLLNAPDYIKWFKTESCSSYSAFHSTRSCVEKKKNKFYCGHETNEVGFLKLVRTINTYTKLQKYFLTKQNETKRLPEIWGVDNWGVDIWGVDKWGVSGHLESGFLGSGLLGSSLTIKIKYQIVFIFCLFTNFLSFVYKEKINC